MPDIDKDQYKYIIEISKSIGEIKGSVDGINKRLDKMNGTISDQQKKISKHDAILGKFGVIFTAIVFLFATACNFVFNWLQKKFF